DPNFFDGCEVVVTRELVNQRLPPPPPAAPAAAPPGGGAGAGPPRAPPPTPPPRGPRPPAAEWGDDGRATLWCSTQNAQDTRSEVAGWLGIDAAQLRGITPAVGGGLGRNSGAR